MGSKRPQLAFQCFKERCPVSAPPAVVSWGSFLREGNVEGIVDTL